MNWRLISDRPAWLWIALAAAGMSYSCSQEPAESANELTPAELLGQGEAMAEHLCATCHAIGLDDRSAHPDAPPLRVLSARVDLDDLREPLMDGIIVDHPDMPEWAFEERHVDALVYYLESVQAD